MGEEILKIDFLKLEPQQMLPTEILENNSSLLQAENGKERRATDPENHLEK